MKRYLLIPVLLFCAPVRADILLPGQAGVYHSFELRGLERAPEGTKLFAFPTSIDGDPLAIVDGQAFSFYKFVSPRIYAYQGELPSFSSCQADPGLPCSEEAWSRVSSLPAWQATRRIHTVYSLVGVEGDRVLLELVSETSYDEAGNEVLPGTPSFSTAWMLLPVAALMALVALAARRRRGRAQAA